MKKRRRYKYKVVKENSNKSCIIENLKYCITYTKGTIVKAVLGTIGIMVFKTKIDAKDFLLTIQTRRTPRIIKRVIPIGKGKVPKSLSYSTDQWYMDHFYRNGLFFTSMVPNVPKGTICYPAVEVID